MALQRMSGENDYDYMTRCATGYVGPTSNPAMPLPAGGDPAILLFFIFFGLGGAIGYFYPPLFVLIAVYLGVTFCPFNGKNRLIYCLEWCLQPVIRTPNTRRNVCRKLLHIPIWAAAAAIYLGNVGGLYGQYEVAKILDKDSSYTLMHSKARYNYDGKSLLNLICLKRVKDSTKIFKISVDEAVRGLRNPAGQTLLQARPELAKFVDKF